MPPSPTELDRLHLLCDQPEGKFKGNECPEAKVAFSLFQIGDEQEDKNTAGNFYHKLINTPLKIAFSDDQHKTVPGVWILVVF